MAHTTSEPNAAQSTERAQPDHGKIGPVKAFVTGTKKSHAPMLTHASHRILSFQELMLVVNPGVFAITATLFAYSLVGYPLWIALPIGLTAGIVLGGIDRMAMLDQRLVVPGTPEAKMLWRRILTVRITMLVFGIFMALITSVDAHRTDLDRIANENIKATVRSEMLANNNVSEYEETIKKANVAIDRKSKLEQALAKAKDSLRLAKSERSDEIKGSINPDTGKRYIQGDGPIAKGWATRITNLTTETTDINAALESIGDPLSVKNTAQTAIDTLRSDAQSRAEKRELGAARQFELFAQLLRQSPAAWVTTGWLLLLLVMPELGMWRALARNPSIERDYARVNRLEDDKAAAMALVAGLEMKKTMAMYPPLVIKTGGHHGLRKKADATEKAAPAAAANEPTLQEGSAV